MAEQRRCHRWVGFYTPTGLMPRSPSRCETPPTRYHSSQITHVGACLQATDTHDDGPSFESLVNKLLPLGLGPADPGTLLGVIGDVPPTHRALRAPLFIEGTQFEIRQLNAAAYSSDSSSSADFLDFDFFVAAADFALSHTWPLALALSQ